MCCQHEVLPPLACSILWFLSKGASQGLPHKAGIREVCTKIPKHLYSTTCLTTSSKESFSIVFYIFLTTSDSFHFKWSIKHWATTCHQCQMFTGWDFWNSHMIEWWIYNVHAVTTLPLIVPVFWLASSNSYRSQQKLCLEKLSKACQKHSFSSGKGTCMVHTCTCSAVITKTSRAFGQHKQKFCSCRKV